MLVTPDSQRLAESRQYRPITFSAHFFPWRRKIVGTFLAAFPEIFLVTLPGGREAPGDPLAGDAG